MLGSGRNTRHVEVDGTKICLISVSYQLYLPPSFKEMGILAKTPIWWLLRVWLSEAHASWSPGYYPGVANR